MVLVTVRVGRCHGYMSLGPSPFLRVQSGLESVVGFIVVYSKSRRPLARGSELTKNRNFTRSANRQVTFKS